MNEKKIAETNLQTKQEKLDVKIQELNEANSDKARLEVEKSNVERDLKTANSRAKKLGVVAGLGWIGALVSLGCVFQNELRNACSTVCKKVSELKNSILG